MSRALFIGCLIVILALCAACGAQGSFNNADPCAQTILGQRGRIAPETSGLTCSEVHKLVYGTPSTSGGFLIVSKSPKVIWKCHIYPSSGDSKDLVSCANGKKRFAVRRLS